MSAPRHLLAISLLSLSTWGCSSISLEPTAPEPQVRKVKSFDGQFEGEVTGTPAPGSRFAQLRIGMEAQPVQKLIGVADQMYSHDTGKRWIPFYLGSDARRIITHYKGEGCLTFTGGTVWGGGNNQLIRIDNDPSGRCYQP
jgi:hypothetical protein